MLDTSSNHSFRRLLLYSTSSYVKIVKDILYQQKSFKPLTLLIVITGLFVAFPQSRVFAAAHSSMQPHALTSCYSGPSQGTCNGQWPDQTNCALDAYTVVSAPIWGDDFHITQWGLVELRYSPHCKTNWTRVSNYDNTMSTNMIAKIGYGACSANETVSYSWTVPNTLQSQIWSQMIYAPTAVAFAEGVLEDPGWSGSGNCISA